MAYSKEQLCDGVEPIIRQAGDILMNHFGKPMAYKDKGDRQTGISYVTPADTHSEALLISQLGQKFPGMAFMAEESGDHGIQADYCWVIDPLDGTTNFVHGIPYFCISVALTHQGEPIFGMIYNPVLDELFYAYKGQGAYLNGKKIAVTAQTAFSKALCVVGLPYAKSSRYMALLETVRELSPKMYAFRHFGAAALDLAHTARGSLDALFLVDLSWWDVAAGMLLVTEAGGAVTDFEGKMVRSDFTSMVAGSKPMQAHLRGLLDKSFRV